jgi:hypothetical protein
MKEFAMPNLMKKRAEKPSLPNLNATLLLVQIAG